MKGEDAQGRISRNIWLVAFGLVTVIALCAVLYAIWLERYVAKVTSLGSAPKSIAFSTAPVTMLKPRAQSIMAQSNAQEPTVIQLRQSLGQGFRTEGDAQTACPGDVVVWVNLGTLIYHPKGDPEFGSGKNGFYACKHEVVSAGFHEYRPRR